MARVFNFGSIRRDPRGSIVRKAIAALTGAALLVGAAADAEAYVVKRTSRGELVHWEERIVTYAIDPSLDRAVANASDATIVSMESWSGTVGAPELTVAPVEETSPKRPGFDQKNGVFFMRGGYGPAGRALAITVLTYDNTSGKILDADIIFNGAYSFEVLPPADAPDVTDGEATAAHLSSTDVIAHDDVEAPGARDDVYDLHHIVAHELGHSLGMNDEMGRKDALMYRYSAPNDASLRQPASDDIAGLAELYSAKLEARGNGCGSAAVAPKRPTRAASRAATFATLGVLLFLILRARTDRRARLGFFLAATAAMVAFVPSLSDEGGPRAARADDRAAGHARAKVLSTSTMIEGGLFKTSYELVTTGCRAASCPKAGHGVAWGGTIGDVTQEVGGYYAPAHGDEVDVTFEHLPRVLEPLTKPLAGRSAVAIADMNVRILTRAR